VGQNSSREIKVRKSWKFQEFRGIPGIKFSAQISGRMQQTKRDILQTADAEEGVHKRIGAREMVPNSHTR